MERLYKFYWDCGRNGEVEGMFIAEEKEVQEAIGKEVYFGEILGKHSEISGTIDEGEITEIKVSETTLKEMKEILGTNISGYNPLDYIRYECSRCGDSMCVYECDWYIDKDGKRVCQYCTEEKENLEMIRS